MKDFHMTYQIFTLVNGRETDVARTHAVQAYNASAATLEALNLVNDWNRAAVVTAKASGLLYHYVLVSVLPCPEA